MLSTLSTYIPIIPLYPRSKRPALAWSQRRGVLATAEELAEWQRNRYNLAAICGPVVSQSGALVVVDADSHEAAGALLDQLQMPTLCVQSRRGIHVWVIVGQALPTVHLPGIDVIGDGLAMMPGSVHPSGHVYCPLLDELPARVATLADILPLVANAIAWPNGSRWQRATPTAPAAPLSSSPPRPLHIAHLAHLLEQRLDAKPSSADGRYWLGRCPWHDDRHPSLSIDTLTQRCRCFACGRTGTVAEALRA